MPILFRNNASALLAASVSTSTTTIVISAGLGASFPSPISGAYFYATLYDSVGNYEIVKVTAKSVDSFTVVRGQDGTSALAFNAGDGFAMRPNAAVFENFVQLDGTQVISGAKTFTGTNVFSGTTQAPTKTVGTNTTDVATTAFVKAAINAFGLAASGTKLLLQQTTAPTGWTKVTTTDNAALRIVSGTAGSGGTVNFSDIFSVVTPAGSVTLSGGTVGNTTLLTAQIPSHTHTHSISENKNATAVTSTSTYGAGYANFNQGIISNGATTVATGSNGAHNHSFSSQTGVFTGTPIDLSVKYIDAIICQKD